MKIRKLFMFFICIILCFLKTQQISKAIPDTNAELLNAYALDTYVYGYPLVLMETTKQKVLSTVGTINQFYHQRTFPTPMFKSVVRPNVDTLYSNAFLDLNKEPIILHLPNTEGKYYIVELLDPWSNVFYSLGTRTTSNSEGNFVLVGPNYSGSVPQNTKKILCPNNTAWIIGRIQTDGEKDYPMVHYLQDNFKLISMSNFGAGFKYSEDNGYSLLASNSDITPKNIVDNMSAKTFFETMAKAIVNSPPCILDSKINLKLATLSLLNNPNFNYNTLNLSTQNALNYAMANAPSSIMMGANSRLKSIENNNWSIVTNNIGTYGKQYLDRAIAAMYLLGANITKDAVYGVCLQFNKTENLDGTKNYIIHFNKDNLPPVVAFWSITLYDSNGFLVENPLNRYAISPHLQSLKYTDGSLDIYVQNLPPSADNLSNWLPSPAGSYNLMLRMYYPKQTLLDGLWTPPLLIKDEDNAN